MHYEYTTISIPLNEIGQVLSEWGFAGWHVIHVHPVANLFLFLLERKRDLQGAIQ